MKEEDQENDEEENSSEKNDELEEEGKINNENFLSDDLIEKLENEEINKSENIEFTDGSDDSNIEFISKSTPNTDNHHNSNTKYIQLNLIILSMQISYVIQTKP